MLRTDPLIPPPARHVMHAGSLWRECFGAAWLGNAPGVRDVLTFFDHPASRNIEGAAVARMTLRRLEIFVTIVEAGGFRACSDLLDISPAAVSHQVNQLEHEIGCRLFVRRR